MFAKRLVTAAAALAGTACASAGGSGATAAASGGMVAGVAVSEAVVFEGTFTPSMQSTAGVGPKNQNRVFGNVQLISNGPGNNQTRVRLTISTSTNNVQLPWAIAPGACGNGAIALLAVSQFGTIDMGSSGRGTLEADLSVALAAGESYHVEVYKSGQTLADVLACSNVRRKSR